MLPGIAGIGGRYSVSSGPRVVATATTTANNPYFAGEQFIADVNIPAYEAGDLSVLVLAARGDGDDNMFELFAWLIGSLGGDWLPVLVAQGGGLGSLLEGAVLINERTSSSAAETLQVPLASDGGTSGRLYAHAFTIRGHRPLDSNEQVSPVLGNADHNQFNDLYTSDNTPTAWRISGPHVSQGLPSLAMTVAFTADDEVDPASHFINSDAAGYESLFGTSTSGYDAAMWTAWQTIDGEFDWGDWSIPGATADYLVWSFVVAPAGLDDQYSGLYPESP